MLKGEKYILRKSPQFFHKTCVLSFIAPMMVRVPNRRRESPLNSSHRGDWLWRPLEYASFWRTRTTSLRVVQILSRTHQSIPPPPPPPLLVGHFTRENYSLRKSPQFSTKLPQRLRSNVSTSRLAKFSIRLRLRLRSGRLLGRRLVGGAEAGQALPPAGSVSVAVVLHAVGTATTHVFSFARFLVFLLIFTFL